MGEHRPFRQWIASSVSQTIRESPTAIAAALLIALAGRVALRLLADNSVLSWLASTFCLFVVVYGLYLLSCAKDKRLSDVSARIAEAKRLGVLEHWESYPKVLKRTLEDVAKVFTQDGKELVRPFDLQLAIPPAGEIRYRHIRLHQAHALYSRYIQELRTVAPELAQQLPQEMNRSCYVEMVRMLEDHHDALCEKIEELRCSVRP